MEDEGSTHSHNCGGRVTGVVFNMRDSVLKLASYDPRNIVDLLEYRDAHIIDSGRREVDTEECYLHATTVRMYYKSIYITSFLQIREMK